jgi:hypothetical protein
MLVMFICLVVYLRIVAVTRIGSTGGCSSIIHLKPYGRKSFWLNVRLVECPDMSLEVEQNHVNLSILIGPARDSNQVLLPNST